MAITVSSALRGGLAGASVLSVLDGIFRRVDKNAPPLKSLGINAVAKVVNGIKGKANQELLHLPVAGQFLTNALYFSLAGVGSKKNVLLRSALLGLTAGLGTLVLPQHLGLTDFSSRPIKSKLTTIAGFFIGSMVAAAAIKALQKNGKKIKSVG
jgi:hypothetical protein